MAVSGMRIDLCHRKSFPEFPEVIVQAIGASLIIKGLKITFLFPTMGNQFLYPHLFYILCR